MLISPYSIGCFTCFAHFENTQLSPYLHLLVRLWALPIVFRLKRIRSTAQYYCASLAAGQHQFHVPVHAPNSSAGSRLGPLNRHCRFGGARWAHPMIRLPRRIIEVVFTIFCSLVRIARDRFCRLQPNLCLLKMPFSTLPDQSLTRFRKDLRSSWSKTALTSTSAAPNSTLYAQSVFMMSDMHAKTSPAAMETATDLLPFTSVPMEPKVIFHGLDLLQQLYPRHILDLNDGDIIVRVFTIDRSSLIGVITKEITASNRSITDGA